MRIGIFGGTFDPIHFGHLLLAEQCREQCGLDEVQFVPLGTPAHRSAKHLTPGVMRAEMVRLAISSNPAFILSLVEIERSGISYMVDTLAAIRAERPDDEAFLLLAADWIPAFSTWREPERITSLAQLVIVNRGGMQLPSRAQIAQMIHCGAEALQTVQITPMPHSSTDLRQRVREGRSILYLTPDAVVEYISDNKLYRLDPHP